MNSPTQHPAALDLEAASPGPERERAGRDYGGDDRADAFIEHCIYTVWFLILAALCGWAAVS